MSHKSQSKQSNSRFQLLFQPIFAMLLIKNASFFCPLQNKSYFCTRKNAQGAIAQLVEQRTENPCVPGSIPGGTTEELLTQEFFLYLLVEQRTGRKNPALCPRFDSWWHHMAVYHNNSSAAFFIGFGLGYKPQYIPCVFILSALHVDHSDASSRANRNIHFNTASLPLWFSGR